MEAQPGSVSTGTHRFVDLIPRFVAYLEELEPEHAWIEEYNHADREIIETSTDDYQAARKIEGGFEDLSILLDELCDILDEYAPDGYYFGAHPGDGSDYGFWEVED